VEGMLVTLFWRSEIALLMEAREVWSDGAIVARGEGSMGSQGLG